MESSSATSPGASHPARELSLSNIRALRYSRELAVLELPQGNSATRYDAKIRPGARMGDSLEGFPETGSWMGEGLEPAAGIEPATY